MPPWPRHLPTKAASEAQASIGGGSRRGSGVSAGRKAESVSSPESDVKKRVKKKLKAAKLKLKAATAMSLRKMSKEV